jgi:hypothetical protein
MASSKTERWVKVTVIFLGFCLALGEEISSFHYFLGEEEIYFLLLALGRREDSRG